MSSEPSIAATATPVVLGLGTFAAIVLTDGTEDLSWTRFIIATLAFFAVTVASGLLVRYWRRDKQ
jgi:small neutral amino acid transporter SnatA (MarC family)